MTVYVVIRHKEELASPSIVMDDETINDFYKKIALLRGTQKPRTFLPETYAGVKILGRGEKWVIYGEMITVVLSGGQILYLIDENREVETWLIYLCKSRISDPDINVINSNFDKILPYSEISC